MNKKIVCLGGGSLYFRSLGHILISKELAGSEIVLYDLDAEKIERMARMVRGLAKQSGGGFRIRATTNLADAVDGASFAISSIGGSGAEISPHVYGSYYHHNDIKIPEKYGIHQVIGDTGGPAGMMMGLRSIPAYLKICREMEKRCPGAVLFSHSNPMAILCRAMHKYSSIQVIGICHGVQGGVERAAKLLELPQGELECVWIGTNHYYWITRLRHHGRDVLPQLMKKVHALKNGDVSPLSMKLSAIYGSKILYDSDDHIVEFYPYLTQIQGGIENLPYGMAKSAQAHGGTLSPMHPRQAAKDPVLRRQFMKKYQTILDASRLPEGHKSNEDIVRMIQAISTGKREVVIANVANRGSVPNLPATAEIEVEAVTDSCGVRPVYMGEAPLVLKAMLEKRFAWHELVVDAAVTGNRQTALQALMLDDMAIRPELAEAMLREMLVASRDLLPQFFKKR